MYYILFDRMLFLTWSSFCINIKYYFNLNSWTYPIVSDVVLSIGLNKSLDKATIMPK